MPLSALQQGQSGALVYVVQPDGTVQQRPVTVAQTLDGRALIDHGLTAGETVVTAGQYRPERRRQGRRGRAGRSARAEQLRSQRGDAVMSIPAPFIRRPIATALLMVAIVLLGGTAYQLLPVAALPNVSFPTISVTGAIAWRRPADDGLLGRHAAGEAVRRNSLSDADDLDQFAWAIHRLSCNSP